MLLMRAEEARASPLALRVERALLRVLSELGFLVKSSPVSYHEAQLAAGCTASSRDCGSQVASVLESEQLVVSSLEDADGAIGPSLRLFRFAPRASPRTGTAQLPRTDSEELELTVRALTESVFADVVETRAISDAAKAELRALHAPALAPRAVADAASPRASSAPAPAPRDLRPPRDRRRVTLLSIGWPSVALGAALVAGGIAQNVAARRDARAYETRTPTTRDEVDAKLAHYDSAQDKTDTARLLMGFGGGLLAAGTFVLLWEHFGPSADRKLQSVSSRSSRSPRPVRVSAAPSPRGLSLSLAAEL